MLRLNKVKKAREKKGTPFNLAFLTPCGEMHGKSIPANLFKPFILEYISINGLLICRHGLQMMPFHRGRCLKPMSISNDIDFTEFFP